jgi:hypothetical protein
MQAITTIGLDIAKSVFQVNGVDTDGNVVIRRSSSGVMYWHPSRSYRDIWLALRLVARRITGHANSRPSATLPRGAV